MPNRIVIAVPLPECSLESTINHALEALRAGGVKVNLTGDILNSLGVLTEGIILLHNFADRSQALQLLARAGVRVNEADS